MTYFDGDEFDPKKYTTLIQCQPKHHDVNVPNHQVSNCDGCTVTKYASERIHALISHENGLRHNRITWFANIEGFLWISFATVISEVVGSDDDKFWLLVIIPIIGILVCLSAISAIRDADAAAELLLQKWRIIQEHSPKSPYAVIPVIGLSYDESRGKRTCSIPRWYFSLFVLIGWLASLIDVIVTHAHRHCALAAFLSSLIVLCLALLLLLQEQ